MFGISAENVAMTYLDADGDDITLNTQEELDEYYVANDISRDSIIRFTIKDISSMRSNASIAESVQDDFEEIDDKTISDHAPSESEVDYSGPTASEKGKFRAPVDDDDARSISSDSTEASLVDAVHVPLIPTVVSPPADRGTENIIQVEQVEEQVEEVEDYPDPPLPGTIPVELETAAQPAPQENAATTPAASLESLIYNDIVKHFQNLDFAAVIDYFKNGAFQSDNEKLLETIDKETRKAINTIQTEYGGLDGISKRLVESMSTAVEAFNKPHPNNGSQNAATTAGETTESAANAMDIDAQETTAAPDATGVFQPTTQPAAPNSTIHRWVPPMFTRAPRYPPPPAPPGFIPFPPFPPSQPTAVPPAPPAPPTPSTFSFSNPPRPPQQFRFSGDWSSFGHGPGSYYAPSPYVHSEWPFDGRPLGASHHEHYPHHHHHPHEHGFHYGGRGGRGGRGVWGGRPFGRHTRFGDVRFTILKSFFTNIPL